VKLIRDNQLDQLHWLMTWQSLGTKI